MPGGVDVLLVLVCVLGHSAAYSAAGAAMAGSLIGSIILFLIARKGGEHYLARYTSHGRGARLKGWFLEYGLLTLFVPGLVPIPMPLKIFVLSAGALGMSPLTFLLVMTAARVPRYFFLAWLGTNLGDQTLPYLRHHIWQLSLFAIALFVILYLLIRLLDRRHRLAKITESE